MFIRKRKMKPVRATEAMPNAKPVRKLGLLDTEVPGSDWNRKACAGTALARQKAHVIVGAHKTTELSWR